MLTWHFTRGGPEGTLAEIGWRAWKVAWSPMGRDEAEMMGYIKEGDWMEVDGRWLAVHRDRRDHPAYHHWSRFGVAFGRRFWLWAVDWPNRNYDTPGAEATREKEAQARALNLTRECTRRAA